MPFPAFYADNLSATLPFLQATDWDAHFSCKGFLTHTKGFPVCPDTNSLSIIKEMIEFIQEVCYWNIIELCQPIYLVRFNMLRKTFLDGFVNAVSHPYLICHFHLHKTFAMPEPTEPVRDIFDFFVFSITLIELSCLQNLSWGAKNKTVYE